MDNQLPPHQPPSGPQGSNLIPLPTGEQAKMHISNLANAVKMFQPTFVNDPDAPGGRKWDGNFEPAEGIDPAKMPTFPQFVNTAAAAIFEIGQFIKLHESLKNILAETQKAFAEIESIVLPAPVNGKESEQLHPRSTIEAVRLLKKEHSQMNDVLEHGAKGPPEKALKACQEWLMFRAKQDNVINFNPPPADDTSIHSNS